MGSRPGLLPVVLGLAVVLAAGPAAALDSGSTATAPRLQSFSGCSALLGHLKRQAIPLVRAGVFGGGGRLGGAVAPATARADAGAPQAGVDYSTTNVQEQGVDEPDLVKTNGDYAYIVARGQLEVVDLRAGRPRVVGSLKLSEGWSHELLLNGRKLLVLSVGFAPGPLADPGPAPAPGTSRIAPEQPRLTRLAEVDVSEPARPRLRRTLDLDGMVLAARLIGSTARIVLTSPIPRQLQLPGNGPDAAEENVRAVAASQIGAWQPRFVRRDARRRVAERGPLVQCKNVRSPAPHSGFGQISVLTVSLDRGLDPVDADAVLTDGQIVYASLESLYVATQRWQQPSPSGEPPTKGVTTELHRFSIDSPVRTTYRGSGQVDGYVLNQWALSEHRDVLRVATTEAPAWWGGPTEESVSSVSTLRVGASGLTPLGRASGLGKGERVYAVRFVGEIGYVVTFRQVDPLYTLDLADPAKPVVRGELKIEGYSAYLHPIDDDLLLGVGQDATKEGRVLGTQLSLFDVSDLRRPRRLSAVKLGPAWSEAESDHRAFLWWPASRLAVVPLQRVTPTGGGAGATGFRVDRTSIREVADVRHPTDTASVEASIRRSFVSRGVLYTVSERGVKGSTLTSLGDVGWAPFG